jgi:hypothetical protein
MHAYGNVHSQADKSSYESPAVFCAYAIFGGRKLFLHNDDKTGLLNHSESEFLKSSHHQAGLGYAN